MSNDDRDSALRGLANRWTLNARDHARDAKTHSANGDSQTAYYHRGIAETYHKAAQELAGLLTSMPASEAAGATSTQTAAPAAPAEPVAQYAAMSLNDAMRVLDYAGVNPRDVTSHSDNIFTAIFSRWHPFNDAERIAKIKTIDARLVVISTGKLRDTGDPYLEFAFKG